MKCLIIFHFSFAYEIIANYNNSCNKKMKKGGEFRCSLIYFLVFWSVCSCYVFYCSPLQKQSPEVYYKKGVLKNFAKFRRKHLCFTPVTLTKKRPWQRCFPLNFAKFLRTPFLQNTSGRLLLPLEEGTTQV